MFPVSNLEWREDGKMMAWISLEDIGEGGRSSFYCPIVGEGAELMQFTGLKDKNGVEIYEGDILVEIYDSGYKPKPFEFPAYGEFCGGGWEESVEGIGYCFEPCAPGMDKCEVIGNIHQTPELLK